MGLDVEPFVDGAGEATPFDVENGASAARIVFEEDSFVAIALEAVQEQAGIKSER